MNSSLRIIPGCGWTFVMAQDLSSLYDKLTPLKERLAVTRLIPASSWLVVVCDRGWCWAVLVRSSGEPLGTTHFAGLWRRLGQSHAALAVSHGSTELLDDVLTNSVAVLMKQKLFLSSESPKTECECVPALVGFVSSRTIVQELHEWQSSK